MKNGHECVVFDMHPAVVAAPTHVVSGPLCDRFTSRHVEKPEEVGK